MEEKTCELSTVESKSLVYLRVIAMFTIIICHIFQAYHVRIWGDIFNLGVQVFFVLSGYLYGYKTIENWKGWYLKRLKKLYIPYLVFLICVVPLYAIFHNEAMNWKVLPFYFANLQGFRFLWGGSFARIEGLRHVWFLTAIMCGYIITPALQKIRNKSAIVIPIMLVFIFVAYFVLHLRIVFVLSWVYLYALGYLYVNLSNRWKKFYNILIVISLFVVIGLIIYYYLNSWQVFVHPYSVLYRLFHDLMGLFIIIIGTKILSNWKNIYIPRVVSFFDKWSFHVYIVHFFIMCGPFSMANLTPYRWINIFILFVATVFFTFVFVMLLRCLDHFTRNKFTVE